ncbi:sigma-70 family RNA polymerase sigma factor [Sphingomonas kyeonggiensis]|uniref:RNA polymerase sigma-70 factor (ECF subfamily) n=1 Tax=Sphingomonas kyeonggiensis TaxID=1268553 RepID=A0A7W6JVR7_9SPHN|nr:RNA polymerase sigma-70 factor (ECF subfamily) [Sphingomonas kyeonggiensis]
MRPDYSTFPDSDLATMSLAGSDGAYAEIVRRYRTPLFRLINGSVPDPDEALDLTQETLVSAHRALRRYDPARPMRSWLSAIALNKCRDWARRRKVRQFFTFARDIDDAAELIADDRPDQAVAAEDRQELARLRRAISTLSASLREPLLLHTVEGLSQSEAAEILGISEKAVETRLRRARIQLHEHLGR